MAVKELNWSYLGRFPTITGNQMDKTMEHEIGTGVKGLGLLLRNLH